MTRCNAVLLTGLLALVALPASAQTVLSPSEDAYVEVPGLNGADPTGFDTPFGTTAPNDVRVRTANSVSRDVYFKFDLASLAGNVQKAILRFTVDAAPGGGTISAVGAVNDTWTEAAITGKSAPGKTDPNVFAASVEVAGQKSTDPDVSYEIDVTALVRAQAQGDKVASIVLSDLTLTSGIDIRIFSKEGTTVAASRPQLVVTTGGVANEDGPEATSFAVHEVRPNPAAGRAAIGYDLTKAGDLSVEAYNVLGQRVAVLHEGVAPAGAGSVAWDGTAATGARLAAGLYVVRFRFDNETVTRTLTLTR